MATNLPTELLRSFVAIVDSGSMLKATERVFVTQSALSLQMKRLEETVLTPLFHRDGRRLTLTASGTALLGHAREILALNDRAVVALTGDALVGPVRVGLVQDFAETLLSGVLARFTQLNPEVQLQVRVAGSPELLDLLNGDRLDVVLCMGAPEDAAAVRVAPMVWHGDPELAKRSVLPLAILEPPCRFRDAALAALDRDGRPYRVALETPSLSALRAAVEAGLAVTCRTALFRPLSTPIEAGLPVVPQVAYVRRVGPAPHPSIAKLSDLMHAAALEL
ncbi:LysR family transcriptional regulator [Caulobacter sp. Root655]|uniref:LysR substrate-binding domain-containing protein n=1 Tax=Caulobacter sp. Root655 TaxID=1736578 RepID=UPI0006FB0F52|nr:LysR substrate-binding domain-containing protein [Caulobacter sp. Root655]KRA56228.1 LysR family transcriptional regulator [Caulobacter sp. Root655]